MVSAPPAARPGAEEPHTAPHDELLGVARELIERSPARTVTLDALANALKARGFSRPPGSPRLITRLRRLRELEVSRSGQITLVDGAGAPSGRPETRVHAPEIDEADEPTPGNERLAPPRAEPAYRSELSYEDRRAAVEAAQRGEHLSEEPPQPDGEPVESAPADGGSPDGGQRRRRSRRGGRRRRRHGAGV